MSFLKRHPFFGLALGIALVASAMLSLTFMDSADAASPRAQAQGAACPLARVALDTGYGLTRTGFRPACP